MPNIGFKHSEESKKRIAEALRGNSYAKGYKFTKEQRKNMSVALRGKKKSDDMRYKLASSISGENHWNWQGGKTDDKERIRNTVQYKDWRRKVFERDGFRCVECGDDKGGNLEADHIKRFSNNPELRFVLENGRTLCRLCHRKTPNYGARKEALIYA